MKKITLLILLITFIFINNIFSQYKTIPYKQNSPKLLKEHKTELKESSTTFFAVSLATFLYLLNPIILLENDKISGGITKEVSLGFGYFGEHRIGLEYSYLFRDKNNSHLRLSYKYDYLFKDTEPSNLLQASTVISLGAGYFTDFEKSGIFPEISFGYSIRNDELLIYPHAKLRYTFTERKYSNIIDFSFGVMIGFANPFIDLKIRKKR